VVEIPLTQGQVAIVDDLDAAGVLLHTWYAMWIRDRWYARCSRMDIYLHRYIMGTPPGVEIDHRDGNGLDNRRNNLRIASHAQNMRNRKVHVTNTSGYAGVDWDEGRGKWRVRVSGRHIGRFSKLQDAVDARHSAATQMHGEFARQGE
jgi:hypothetical protein